MPFGSMAGPVPFIQIELWSIGLSALPGARRPRYSAVLLFGGAAVGAIAIHLATNSTLGFHTDELYYLACGRHPALGYVDFPPLVPLLARLETGLLGASPWRLARDPWTWYGTMRF